MLTEEKNRLLTQTDRGTPMGDLFRRYWLPALRCDELSRPDGTPVRVRLLGEDLVAFRDTSGCIGLVGEYCPHRRTSLFLGRNEENGLRCIYHGWKFDVTGRCVDMPSEPANSTFKDKVRATSYPCVERGAVVWTYMGPAGLKPEEPSFEWSLVSPPHRLLTKWLQDTNYLQALEGTLDSSHLSFLHRGNLARQHVRSGDAPQYLLEDTAPEFHITDTEHGITIGAKRRLPDGMAYWRMSQLVLPAFSFVPHGDLNARSAFAFVPADDTHVWAWEIYWHPTHPMSDDERAKLVSGIGSHMDLVPGTFLPKANRENGFLQNRELQASGASFTGMPGVSVQDYAVQKSAGDIIDRTLEHLGTSDRAIIELRRQLELAVRDVAEGRQPKGLRKEHSAVRAAGFVLPWEAPYTEREALLQFDPVRDLSPEPVP